MKVGADCGPQGLKAQDFGNLFGTAKQAAEKVGFRNAAGEYASKQA